MAIAPPAVRDCASETVKGSDLLPSDVDAATVVAKVKTLSPAVRSPPLIPSSKKSWLERPIAERLALTVIPVLAGAVAGVTFTVNTAGSPAATDDGVAVPTPLNSVGTTPPWGVS